MGSGRPGTGTNGVPGGAQSTTFCRILSSCAKQLLPLTFRSIHCLESRLEALSCEWLWRQGCVIEELGKLSVCPPLVGMPLTGTTHSNQHRLSCCFSLFLSLEFEVGLHCHYQGQGKLGRERSLWKSPSLNGKGASKIWGHTHPDLNKTQAVRRTEPSWKAWETVD